VKRLNKISVLLALLLIGCSNNIQNESTGKDFLPENVSLNELSKYSVIYPLEIDFWSGLGPSINASLTKVIEDFGDLYPNIKVNLESRAGQIEESVLLSIPSDTYPNLVTVFPEHLTSFMKSDIVYALDPYLENEIYGFDLTTFDSELLAVNQRFYNNSLGNPYTFGLPFLSRSQVMYANDDFLKFAQSLDDKLVVPKTWNGLEEFGEGILDIMNNTPDKDGDLGLYGKKVIYSNLLNQYLIIKQEKPLPENYDLVINFESVTVDNFKILSLNSYADLFYLILKQQNIDFIQGDWESLKPKLSINNQSVVDTLSFFKNLMTKDIIDDAADSGLPIYLSDDKFFKTQSILHLNISGNDWLSRQIQFNASAHPIPYYTESNKVTLQRTFSVALLKDENPDKVLASYLLAKHLVTHTTSTQIAIEHFGEPVTFDGLNSTEYQSFLNQLDSRADKITQESLKINKDVYIHDEPWHKIASYPYSRRSNFIGELEWIFYYLVYGVNENPLTNEEVILYISNKLSDYFTV